MKNFKIMIVDDNDFFRETLKITLQRYFPKGVIKEGDGHEAMENVGDFMPDLIFMDVQLDGDNGLALTRKIKASYPNIIVVILTTFDIPEYREAATEYGADRFLAKSSLNPTGLQVLVQSYQRALQLT